MDEATPPAPGSTREPEPRREQIVRSAATVLGRLGYAATSLKEIAREAGVAPGLLHYYFASKEDLLVAVLAALEAEMTADWQDAVRPLDDPLERIVAALDRMADRSTRHPEFFRLLLDLSVLGIGSPALRRRCQELWGRFADGIEAEVRQTLGRLPAYSVVPPHELAAAIAGAVQGNALAGLLLETSADHAFHALKVMVLSLVVTAYVIAGHSPPLAELGELLTRTDVPAAAHD